MSRITLVSCEGRHAYRVDQLCCVTVVETYPQGFRHRYAECQVQLPLRGYREGQTQFTRELVGELVSHQNVIGLFWWFPEENAFGNQVTKGWLNRGLFDNRTGQALPALSEFGKYR